MADGVKEEEDSDDEFAVLRGDTRVKVIRGKSRPRQSSDSPSSAPSSTLQNSPTQQPDEMSSFNANSTPNLSDIYYTASHSDIQTSPPSALFDTNTPSDFSASAPSAFTQDMSLSDLFDSLLHTGRHSCCCKEVMRLTPSLIDLVLHRI